MLVSAKASDVATGAEVDQRVHRQVDRTVRKQAADQREALLLGQHGALQTTRMKLATSRSGRTEWMRYPQGSSRVGAP